MKLPVLTLTVLLPLAASTLAPKKRERDEDNSPATSEDERARSQLPRSSLENQLAFDVTVPPLAASGSSSEHTIENNNNNNNNNQKDPMELIPGQLTWDKKELANLVKDLRYIDEEQGTNTMPFGLEKIIMKEEYLQRHNSDYYDRLAEKINAFGAEAEMHGLKIGGAVKFLIIS